MTEANAMIASVSVIPVKVIKTLHSGYQIPDPLPWCWFYLAISIEALR